MTEKCIIIGLGKIGMEYDLDHNARKIVYSHAKAFSNHPAFELIGAVDPSEKKRNVFKKHYGQIAYSTIEGALKTEQASIVVIASPTEKHNITLKQVLAFSRPKIIVCEKPLAYDLDEAREMVRLCKTAGVKLFVNYMRRADPGSLEIKERIEAGKIATPIKGVVWYSKGFLHNGSHFFNLLEFWLGSFIKAQILAAGRGLGNQDSEPDVVVEFKWGKVVFISAWEEAFSHYTIELLSPSGRLRYDQGGKYITWQSTQKDAIINGYQVLTTNPEILVNGMDYYQWHVVDQLANVIENKPTYLSTGNQALATLEAMHLIIKQGK